MGADIQAAGGISVQPAVPLYRFTGSLVSQSEFFRLLTLRGAGGSRETVCGIQATDRAFGAPADLEEELGEFIAICRAARPGAALHSSLVTADADGTSPARLILTRTGFAYEPDERAAARAAAEAPEGDDPDQPYIPMPVPDGITSQAGPDGRIPLWCTVHAPTPTGRWQVVLNGRSAQSLHDEALRAAAEHGQARVWIDMSREVLATYQRPEPAVTALEAIARAQRLADGWAELAAAPEPSAYERDGISEALRLALRAAEYAQASVAALDPLPPDVRRAHEAADFRALLAG
ncbi:hypothetical protein ACFXPX_36780 [Kitasatospora sp. NPDC059146]|uniref:hypothetical protein n=1 Tax=unclassified Kitasatospora TaxID=2633591 RepID=UPI00369089E0